MEPTASRPAHPVPAPEASALAALLDCEADLDALERALLVVAVHPTWAAGSDAWLARWDERRGWLEGWRTLAATADVGPLAHAIARARRAPPGEEAASERVRAFVASVDSLEGALARAWNAGELAIGPGSEQPSAPWAERERVAVLPLRRGPKAYGVLVIALAADAAEAPLSTLQTAADAALAAQVRAAEARRRARHLAALAEFARAAVSASNVAEGVHALVRLAAQSVGVPHAAVYRVRENGTLALELAHGPSATRDLQARALQASAAECRRAERVLSGTGADSLPSAGGEVVSELSVWAVMPITAYGVATGVLAAWDGAERHTASPEWERGDLETLATLADQAALLFEHARRLEELTNAERKREDLASRLREQDRLAAVGEMAARVAEDARQPLASVAAFVARVLRELPTDDPRREYLDVVRREAERVDALLNEQLAYAKLERPRLRMEVLNGVVHEALRAAAEPLSRRRVRLVKKFAPDLPELLLDAERIRRVVTNIVTCALEAIPSGGRMRVETRRAGAFVVLDVIHDRVRQAGDALDQLFAPFGALPVSGAALGLGVAHQIVREHGGEIRVKAQDEWSSAFSVTLPVMENQDRRRRADRRVPRGERRRGPSEA
jgi:signal transduction histidine kinase